MTIAYEKMIDAINERRLDLGISKRCLAQRSGVSSLTVQRFLKGTKCNVNFATMVEILSVLGLQLKLTKAITASQLIHRQARRRAKQLLKLSKDRMHSMTPERLELEEKRIYYRLLGGSRRNLW